MNLKRVLLVALVISFCVAPVVILTTSCAHPPSERVVAVSTLKATGHSAEAAMTLVANLYAANRITGAQAKQAIELYDTKFQPAFRVAVAAVNANLNAVAPAELTALAAQISVLVASFSAANSTP